MLVLLLLPSVLSISIRVFCTVHCSSFVRLLFVLASLFLQINIDIQIHFPPQNIFLSSLFTKISQLAHSIKSYQMS